MNRQSYKNAMFASHYGKGELKMAKLTEKQLAVLTVLPTKGGMAPVDIGMHYHKNYSVASSWSCSALKPLVRMGLAQRILVVPGDVRYLITELGGEVLKNKGELK